jgi:hypothetical protein
VCVTGAFAGRDSLSRALLDDSQWSVEVPTFARGLHPERQRHLPHRSINPKDPYRLRPMPCGKSPRPVCLLAPQTDIEDSQQDESARPGARQRFPHRGFPGSSPADIALRLQTRSSHPQTVSYRTRPHAWQRAGVPRDASWHPRVGTRGAAPEITASWVSPAAWLACARPRRAHRHRPSDALCVQTLRRRLTIRDTRTVAGAFVACKCPVHLR